MDKEWSRLPVDKRVAAVLNELRQKAGDEGDNSLLRAIDSLSGWQFLKGTERLFCLGCCGLTIRINKVSVVSRLFFTMVVKHEL
ncbi:MAG: hypothetical protein Q8N85_06200, partial [Candidatus Omnitrophota bacterium]|nr:hypothetical protein [Candidatus Omnitrophota bacterium]